MRLTLDRYSDRSCRNSGVVLVHRVLRQFQSLALFRLPWAQRPECYDEIVGVCALGDKQV
jgi:hypothetical protein